MNLLSPGCSSVGNMGPTELIERAEYPVSGDPSLGIGILSAPLKKGTIPPSLDVIPVPVEGEASPQDIMCQPGNRTAMESGT